MTISELLKDLPQIEVKEVYDWTIETVHGNNTRVGFYVRKKAVYINGNKISPLMNANELLHFLYGCKAISDQKGLQ